MDSHQQQHNEGTTGSYSDPAVPHSPREIACPNSIYGCTFTAFPDKIDEHLQVHCEKQQLKEYIIEKEAEVIRLRNDLHIREAELANLKLALGTPKQPSKLIDSLTKAKTDISDAFESLKNSETLQTTKQKSAEASQKLKETFQSWGESAAKKFDELKESEALQNVGEKVRRASIKVKESVRRASSSASDAPTSPTSTTAPAVAEVTEN